MAVQYTNNFEPVDDLLPINRAGAPLNDKTLANPRNALALFDGEWVVLSSGKLVRATVIGSVGNPSTHERPHPYFSEAGSMDVQASPDGIGSYIVGPYGTRWRTRVYDPTVSIGSGTTISGAYGQPLKVATISIVGPGSIARAFTGLVGHGGIGSGDTHKIVGRVCSVANGVLEFIYELRTPNPTPFRRTQC